MPVENERRREKVERVVRRCSRVIGGEGDRKVLLPATGMENLPTYLPTYLPMVAARSRPQSL